MHDGCKAGGHAGIASAEALRALGPRLEFGVLEVPPSSAPKNREAEAREYDGGGGGSVNGVCALLPAHSAHGPTSSPWACEQRAREGSCRRIRLEKIGKKVGAGDPHRTATYTK